MKKMKFLGLMLVSAMALMVFAACVYEEGTGTVVTPPPTTATGNHFPTATTTFTPGTFTSAPIGGNHAAGDNAQWQEDTGMGAMTWRRGPLVVEVDFSENQILDIRLISHGESAYSAMYLFRAYPMVPDQILMQQSTGDLRITAGRDSAIDVFTGGTATQASIVLAVEDAIRQAGADPLALTAHPLPSTPLPGDRFVPGSHTVYVPAETYVMLADGTFRHVDTISNWVPPEGAGNADRIWRNPEGAAFHDRVREGTGGQLGQRVLYNSPNIAARNNNAVHGPTLHQSSRAGGSAAEPLLMNEGAMNNIGREMGFDAATENPFYNGGAPVGLWVTVNFGRNYFQLLEHSNGDGLGTAGSGGGARPFSGESLAPSRDGASYGAAGINAIGMNGSTSSQALGGYFWIQGAHRSINDRQSTLHVDLHTYSGATQSAIAVRLGVEKAMELAGATPATIQTFTPRAVGDSPFWREHHTGTYGATGLRLIPGRYEVPLNYEGAPNAVLRVVLCRSAIRYVTFVNANGNSITHAAGAGNDTTRQTAADAGFFPQGLVSSDDIILWARGNNADNPFQQGDDPMSLGFRTRLLFAFADTYANGGRTAASLASAPLIPGQEALSEAIIAALQTVVTENNYNNINQSGRLGYEVITSSGR
jgi:uncharacterized protein with FMN-binding domain